MANELVIRRIRGMNNTDAPSALPDDQCVDARNVEFNRSTLGERRRGYAAIDLTGGDLEAADLIFWLHRHLPTSDETESELYAFGYDGSHRWVYRDTAWNTVTFQASASPLTGLNPYANQIYGQSFHGKLFVAYKSAKDRLHVIEDGEMRLTGLAEPAAPTAADAGGGSTFTGTRYYRQRYVVMDGATVLRRSEPSEVLTFTPAGTGASATVTKSATISEGETHWELEASLDNANFYRIARTVVATTTFSDTHLYTQGYAATNVLSETITDYTTLYSAKYLVVDQDRLILLGSYTDEADAARVAWTPVGSDPGVGNDERFAASTDYSLDLDGLDGGGITGGSSSSNGYVYVFKQSAIYKLVRTGIRQDAYEAFCITKSHGAVPGSVVDAIDEVGNPVVYFLDPRVGPCVLGANGVSLQPCGADILETWKDFNVDAEDVPCRGLYYPENRQVHWLLATTASTPTIRIVLQTSVMQNGRYGWSIWDGESSSQRVAMCLFAENIDDGVARTGVLRPFVAGQDVILRGDTGDEDNGTAYAAYILTKPYMPATILNHFGVRNAAILGKAVEDGTLEVTLRRDFKTTGVERTVDFTPVGDEEQVIRKLDSLEMHELRALQIEFADPDTPGPRWELNQFAVMLTSGQKS